MPRPYVGAKQKHLTVTVYPYEWEKITYMASASGVSVSRFICDKMMKFIEKNGSTPPELIERDKTEKALIKPLSFDEHVLDYMKGKVKESGMKFSPYLVSVILR